jgi:hypothetical protein
LILVNTWLPKQVHQLVAEDVVVEDAETVVETVVTVQTVATAQIVVTEEVTEEVTVVDSADVDVEGTVAAVPIVPTSEADVVVHAEEPMFLKSTTPRRSLAWAHSMLTLYAHDHRIITRTLLRSEIASRGTAKWDCMFEMASGEMVGFYYLQDLFGTLVRPAV